MSGVHGRADLGTDLAKSEQEASSRDQFQRYGHQLLAKEMPDRLWTKRSLTERENSEKSNKEVKGQILFSKKPKICCDPHPQKERL